MSVYRKPRLLPVTLSDMRNFLLVVLLALTACASHSPQTDPAALVWKPGTIGTGCAVELAIDKPAAGDRTLRIITQAQPNDPRFDLAVAQALIVRRDGKPIATLGEFARPGASLTFNIYRDASTGDGYPDFSLPYLFLLVQHADGSTSRLIWESPYNGYSPWKKAVVPENQWLKIDVLSGIYWPQTDTTNFNMHDGFQNLTKYASGFQTKRKDGKISPQYLNESPVIAIGVGSGPNLNGHMLAYLGAVELTIPAPAPRTAVFKP